MGRIYPLLLLLTCLLLFTSCCCLGGLDDEDAVLTNEGPTHNQGIVWDI